MAGETVVLEVENLKFFAVNYLLVKLVNKLVVGEGQLTELGELADNRREKPAKLLRVISETGDP